MAAAADILQVVGAVTDPVIHQSLSQLKMLKKAVIDQQIASISIELPTHAYPEKEALTRQVEEAVRGAFPEVTKIDVQLPVVVKGKQSGGNIGLRIKNIIAVGSGKGGVGKSTVAASIAYGLHHWGASVGLLDADVYGPSVPHMVGATGQPAIKQHQLEDGRTYELIEPIEAAGVKVISMGFMVDPDQAVIWRGPMLHKALSQFLQQTDWGELDYLIIDMPPGTGDVALTLSQMVSLAGAVVVCTPQQVALLDAGKAISMFNTVKIPLIGMVENMVGDLFGRGGAKTKAEAMNIPFLGEIPSDPLIRIRADEGEFPRLFSEENSSREELLKVASNVAMSIARETLENPSLPTLELL